MKLAETSSFEDLKVRYVKFSRFLAYIGGGSLFLNIMLGIYINILSISGNLRPDWYPIAGKLMIMNMAIVAGLVTFWALMISHSQGEEVA